MIMTTFSGDRNNGVLVWYSDGHSDVSISGIGDYFSDFIMALSPVWRDFALVDFDALQFRFLSAMRVLLDHAATAKYCFGGEVDDTTV